MTTSYPTLAATWSPSSQCVASTAFYYIIESSYSASGTDAAGVIYNLMFGVPTPTAYGTVTDQAPSGTCVPPAFATDAPYVTDDKECPAGYSIACATGSSYSGGGVASAVTCCPSGAFDFECGANAYGCLTSGSVGQTWIGYRTDLVSTTEVPDHFTVREGDQLFAWGIKLLFTAPGSTSDMASETGRAASTMTTSYGAATSVAGTSWTSAASAGDGHHASAALSTGATAGIAAGGTLAVVVVLTCLGWFVVNHRKKARRQQAAWQVSTGGHEGMDGAGADDHTNTTMPPVAQYRGASPPRLFEMASSHKSAWYTHELPGHRSASPAELAAGH